MRSHSLPFSIGLVLLLLTCLGCGSKPVETGPVGKVEGKVAYKGKAIKIGTVLIVSEDGKFKGSGLISPDGTYLVEKAPAGKVKVFLQFPELPESFKPRQAPPGAPAPPLPKDANPAQPELSAQEMELFKSIAQLPKSITEPPGNFFLNLTVKEGEITSFNIDLKTQVPR